MTYQKAEWDGRREGDRWEHKGGVGRNPWTEVNINVWNARAQMEGILERYCSAIKEDENGQKTGRANNRQNCGKHSS